METKPEELSLLDGARIDRFVIRLDRVKQLRQSGWKGFSLCLEDQAGLRCAPPVIQGIFSRGGKDGVKPWFDIVYRERVEFPGSQSASTVGPTSCWDTNRDTLSLPLFRLLGGLIPPGGHVMVSYEEEDPIHIETMLGLQKGIPPAATPLGWVLFLAGFPLIKNWYLSEGGHEGPRKLWAERPPDPATKRMWEARTREELRGFSETIGQQDPEPVRKSACSRALRLLQDIGIRRSVREPQP